MGKKFYAVKSGRQTGIFSEWDECQRSIAGFSGAQYKAFNTLEEAEAYIKGEDIYLEKVKLEVAPDTVVAYCDGSFDERTKRYAYGVVIIDPELKEHELCYAGASERYAGSNNIIGEVFGALTAMDWAVSNGYPRIKIFHDYEGIEAWATGRWKAKSPIATIYQKNFQIKYAGILDVSFHKVEGHSNNKYNELADALARKALFDGVKVMVKGENWCSIFGCSEKNIVPLLELLQENFKGLQYVRDDSQEKKIIYRLKYEKDKLTVSIHTSKKNTLLVQGTQSFLFQIFVTYINEFFPEIEPEKILGNVYRKSINREGIAAAFNTICPEIPDDWPPTLQKLIRQCLINLKYWIDAEDYSQYAFPALRALEGHIRYLLKRGGVAITAKDGLSCFSKKGNTREYILCHPAITDEGLRARAEEEYNYYVKWRHSLFHYGDFYNIADSVSDETRTLNSMDDAMEIINECLRLICE